MRLPILQGKGDEHEVRGYIENTEKEIWRQATPRVARHPTGLANTTVAALVCCSAPPDSWYYYGSMDTQPGPGPCKDSLL